MDDRYRYFLRQWKQSPNDVSLRLQLNQEIERMGSGMSVYEALQIRAISQEVLLQFGLPDQPSRYSLELDTRRTASSVNLIIENQEALEIIHRAVLIASTYQQIDPGQTLDRELILDLTHPIFLLMSSFARPHWAAARITDHHAYPENLLLYGVGAQMYADLHLVPLQTSGQPPPPRILNQVILPPDPLPANRRRDAVRVYPVWCYRLFNPQVFDMVVEIAGCWGSRMIDQGRARGRFRGCRQFVRACICETLCRGGCFHCSGQFNSDSSMRCGHPTGQAGHSQCVCDDFRQESVGPTGFDTHPLGYLCGCRGGGWASTEYDSTHRCPMHVIASHHPECASPELDIKECCDPPPNPPQPPTPPPTGPFVDDLPF